MKRTRKHVAKTHARIPAAKPPADELLFNFYNAGMTPEEAAAELKKFGVKSGVQEIERIFRELHKSERLFVPAQALREFGRHRTTALRKAFEAVHEKISKQGEVVSPLKCPMLDHCPEFQGMVQSAEALSDARKAYSASLNKLRAALLDWTWDDRISVLYAEVFTGTGRVISPSQSTAAIEKDLQYRMVNNLPPGYKDKSKDDGGIGDILIWHSILDLAERVGRNVIFVCNEEKPDRAGCCVERPRRRRQDSEGPPPDSFPFR